MPITQTWPPQRLLSAFVEDVGHSVFWFLFPECTWCLSQLYRAGAKLWLCPGEGFLTALMDGDGHPATVAWLSIGPSCAKTDDRAFGVSICLSFGASPVPNTGMSELLQGRDRPPLRPVAWLRCISMCPLVLCLLEVLISQQKKTWGSTSGCEVPALEVCVIPLLKKLKAMGHQKPSVGQIMDLQGLVKVQSVAESRSSQDSPRHL